MDLAEHVRPRLTVMDAVEGMDGDGPSGGRKVAIGVFVASDNVHALDTVALRVVGEEPRNVWTVRIAIQRGLLQSDPLEGVEVRGALLEEVRVEGFQMPPKERAYGGFIPEAMGAFIGEGVARKPVFSRKLCIGCGKCVDICPAGVLSLRRDQTPKVGIHRDGCIRCYCCHEVCPENAVHLRRMPLRSWGRAIRRRIGRRGRKEGRRAH
ncbi:TPA: 4Fe-4S binding protein [Thermoplasmata archaeon]|nr:4Fe-4S binding protein [Thermoplasmata archaeon]